MSAPEISHGRGGAGNINADDTKYTDAEIVRAGEEGTGVSTGRGGAANIMDKNAAAPRTDADVVPPEATRPSTENKDYHVGRGGAGNEHLAPGHDKKLAEAADKAGKGGNVGLADKLKAKVTGIFKK